MIFLRLWLDKNFWFYVYDFKGFFQSPKFQATAKGADDGALARGFPCRFPQSYPQTLGAI
ncbi:MAG: hypothetical protein LBD68_10555 [Zoogloeaceae bacterium]|nr:hypothetical protein [Zoogloeaceae bacterium]